MKGKNYRLFAWEEKNKSYILNAKGFVIEYNTDTFIYSHSTNPSKMEEMNARALSKKDEERMHKIDFKGDEGFEIMMYFLNKNLNSFPNNHIKKVNQKRMISFLIDITEKYKSQKGN